MADRRVYQAKYRAGRAIEMVRARQCSTALEEFRIASELVGEAIQADAPDTLSAMQATARAQEALNNSCLRNQTALGRPRRRKGRR